MIDTLITALSKELELSAEEIADTIWLALQIQESQSESTATQNSKNDLSQPSSKSKDLEGETLPEKPTQTSDSGESASKQLPDEQKAGIYPRNQHQTLFKSELSFKVPDAPSLREPLTLARALKPLMRRIPSGTTLVLDEAATTQRIANEGLWLPVLRPTLEPWLDLELVVDEGISMQIWRHTIRELERLLKNYGIFRDVRVWGLIADNVEQVQIRRGIGATAKNQSPRSPAELIDPSGRRLVLVVSDCVSSLWRDGKVTTTLEIWAKQGSMAIVQMLPKWLWKRTALGRASEVRLQGLNPGDFNQKLIAKEVSFWDELEETRGVKVPVFTLEPDKVATWAQMLSGKGGIWTSGYVFKLDPILVNKGRELFNLNYGQQSAEQRVQAFRVTASPMARKLAGLLAAAPAISLPIVRLIQRTLLKESQQVHVAEVFLGGLLRPLSEINAETNPDYVQYEFMDGVRELLVDSVPSGYVLNVVDEVSKDVAKNLGLSLEDFAAVLRNPQQVRDSEIAGNVGYFATVTAQVLRRLGGEYVKVAEELEIYNRPDYQENVQANLDYFPDIEYLRRGTLPQDSPSYIKRKADDELYHAVKARHFNNLSPEDAEYVLNLPYHLAEAGKGKTAMTDDLSELLTDYEFIEYKIFSLPPQLLIDDYDLALHPDIQIHQETKESLKLIQSAIKLAANVLADDPAQLAGQLWGRLQSFKKPEIQAMLSQTQESLGYIWLRPLTSNLTPPEGTLVRTLTGHLDWVKGVAITPDGKIAVSASEDKTLKVWDLSSGVELRTFTGHSGYVQGVAITSDGKIAVSASEDKTLKVWDLSSGCILKTFTEHTKGVNAVAITHDRKLVVSGSQDKTLKIWDLDSGNVLHTLSGHNDSVTAIAITPDDKLAVSGAWDKTLRVWDLQSGNQLRILTGHTGAVRSVAITPDGNRVVSAADDDTLRVWDLSSENEIPIVIEKAYRFHSVAITTDGRLAICGANASPIKIYDLQTGQKLRTLSGHTLIVNAIAITPNGQWAVSASSDTTIKVWNLYAEDVTQSGHEDWVNAVAISSDGRLAVSSSEDRTLKLWDLPSGTEIRTLTGHKDHVNGVVITPDCQHVISASDDRTIKIWDLYSGNELRTLTGYYLGEVLAITTDGQNVISEFTNKSLKVWDFHSGSELRILKGHSAVAVAITPDGRLAVSASRDKTLKVWDINSGTELHTLTGHTDWVNAVAISPNGKLAVSASNDNTLKVWDINSGTELNTLIGHYYWVRTVAITPDGRFVVSGSWDKTLKVWDLESGEDITTFDCEGEVNACAISPDGVTVVAAGRSDKISFLRLEGLA